MRPIFTLAEVTLSWHRRFVDFFRERGYETYYVNGSSRKDEYHGLLLAYHAEDFEEVEFNY